MATGNLYLIPTPLGDNDPREVLPAPLFETISRLSCYVVEEVRTARRFLSSAGMKGHIQELEFHELNEHTADREVDAMAALFNDGRDVGLITEAGLPAVADPGARLVALCHQKNIEVVPFVGPSSLMMALMSSGLNGQSFAFCGYLPAKTDERRKAISAIERRSAVENQTQIFIETPYRNDQMLADLLSFCKADTRITLACNITMPDAYIRTKKVSDWKKQVPVLGKRPCVFLLLGKK